MLTKFRCYATDNNIARSKTSYVDLSSFDNIDFSKDRLVVQTDYPLNMIKMARKNIDIYQKYIKIISNDYILINHKDGYSVFMKREKYAPEKTAKYSYLKRYKNLIYTVTLPENKKFSPSLPMKLLVLFSHMNGGGGYDSSNAIERLFVQYFMDIQRSLVKNTIILRIADLNLSHGSYFINTNNYPNYEQSIQDLISWIRTEYDIVQDNVVLYGGSKGGTGALVHAALGNYNAVVGDPIINASKYNEKDWHFIKNFREADLSQKIINDSNGNTAKMYIIASNAQPFNFKASSDLAKKSDGLISIVDVSNDVTIKKHPHITAQSVPEQITLINLLLDGSKIVGDFLSSKINTK